MRILLAMHEHHPVFSLVYALNSNEKSGKSLRFHEWLKRKLASNSAVVQTLRNTKSVYFLGSTSILS